MAERGIKLIKDYNYVFYVLMNRTGQGQNKIVDITGWLPSVNYFAHEVKSIYL